MGEVHYDRLRPGAGGDQGTSPLQNDMNRVTTLARTIAWMRELS